MTAPQATDIATDIAPPTVRPGGLNRPVRAVVALAELVAAGLAVWGAFWAWPQGFATITTVVADGTALESQRVFGNWLAAAIAFGTLAAVLVLDAARQIVLAVRARPRRVRKDKGSAPVPEAIPETARQPTPDSAADAAPSPVSEAVSDAKVTGDD